MVTSSNSEMDEGFIDERYGADDYITKPYSPQVLLLRIAAVLKRVEAPSNVRNFRHLNIDLARGVITGAEAVNSTSQNSLNANSQTATKPAKPRRVLLTKNEMIILSHLLEAKGEIVTRDALMTDLWNNQEYINDNALTVNVLVVCARNLNHSAPMTLSKLAKVSAISSLKLMELQRPAQEMGTKHPNRKVHDNPASLRHFLREKLYFFLLFFIILVLLLLF